MAVHTTIESLVEKIMKDVQETVETDVVEEVVSEHLDIIENVVYDAYRPKKYVRRRSSGGLKDRANVRTRVRRSSKYVVTMKLTNVAKSNRRYTKSIKRIAESIEYGTGVMKPIGARPFMEETRNAVNAKGIHRRAFVEGMRKRGYNVLGR